MYLIEVSSSLSHHSLYSYCSFDPLRSVLLGCLFLYGSFLNYVTPPTPPLIAMAAPADITIKNLNGEWTLVGRLLLLVVCVGTF